MSPDRIENGGGNAALLGISGFYATEAILALFDVYGYSKAQQSWGLPSGSHIWIAIGLLLAAGFALLPGRSAVGARVAALYGVASALGFALLSEPPSWMDALWYATPALIVAASRGFRVGDRRDADATAYLLAGIMANAALLNALNYGNVQAEYVRWGFPDWWNHVTASYEAALAVALVVRRSRRVAIVAQCALVCVIVAALVLSRDWWKLIEMGYFAVPMLAMARQLLRGPLRRMA